MHEKTWEVIYKRKEAKLRSRAEICDDHGFNLQGQNTISQHFKVRNLAERDKNRQINEKISETKILINKNNEQSQRHAYNLLK